MRTFGIILSLLCTVISIGLLLLGYVLIFDDYQVVPQFESTPREGWDHWMRLEYWHDLRAYSIWILMALGGISIPVLGLVRIGRPTSSRVAKDRLLFSVATIYFFLWSRVVVQALSRADIHWIQIAPLIMLAGCIFGLLAFFKRSRFRNNQKAEHGGGNSAALRASP